MRAGAKVVFTLVSICLSLGCGQKSEVIAPTLKPTDTKGSVAPSELDIATLDKCKKATVIVGNFENGKIHSFGTGFVAEDGKSVFTNKHVVTGSDNAVDACKLVFYPGTPQARVVQVSADKISTYADAKPSDKDFDSRDVARVRLGAVVAEPLEKAEMEAVHETQNCWAVGYPNGIDVRLGSASLPSPTVHSLKLERIESKDGKIFVLQLGGSPTHGNSGGPVVDSLGRVMGIVQAKGDAVAPIIYAIPFNIAQMLGADETAKQEFLAPISTKEKQTGVAQADRSKESEEPRKTETISVRGPGLLESHMLSLEELEEMSPSQLTLLRNQPFARRGYRFSRAAIRNAFKEFDWYTIRTSNLSAVERNLSSMERTNIDRIRVFQNATGKTW
jgi:hypothetical protein